MSATPYTGATSGSDTKLQVDYRARRQRMEQVGFFNQPLAPEQIKEVAGAFDPDVLDVVLRFSNQIALGPSEFPNVVVNAAPKSGSSFIFALIKYAMGYAPVNLQLDELTQTKRPGCLDSALITRSRLWSDKHQLPIVSHHHFLCGKVLGAMINRFQLSIVLPYRHVGDSIISYRDFFQGLVKDKGPLAEPQPFGVRAPVDLVERSNSEQIDYWIEVAGRWYFEYLASWSNPAETLWKQPLWIRYEDMIQDKVSAALIISAYLGESCKQEQLAAMIQELEKKQNHGYIKFNKGVAGRWDEESNEAQKARLQEIVQLYPGAEFGLEAAGGPGSA